ncbi:MAG: hypothetical protein K9H26_19545 [Prolixibacteraceae bacterium]|nr:hypothetical protein [Prolixibacteraceae bacterium]
MKTKFLTVTFVITVLILNLTIGQFNLNKGSSTLKSLFLTSKAQAEQGEPDNCIAIVDVTTIYGACSEDVFLSASCFGSSGDCLAGEMHTVYDTCNGDSEVLLKNLYLDNC